MTMYNSADSGMWTEGKIFLKILLEIIKSTLALLFSCYLNSTANASFVLSSGRKMQRFAAN